MTLPTKNSMEVLKEIFYALRSIPARAWNVILVLLLCLSVYQCTRNALKAGRDPEEKADTVVVTTPGETVSHRVETIEKSDYKLPKFVVMHATDTVTVKADTVLVRRQAEYKDSTYQAWVSGIDARLDSIRTFARRIEITDTTFIERKYYITQKKKSSRVRLGIQVGYGITPKGLQPYAGLGLTYSFW